MAWRREDDPELGGRRPAATGAAVAGLACLGASALDGDLGWAEVAAALAAVAACLLVSTWRRPPSRLAPAVRSRAVGSDILAASPDPVILVDRRSVVVDANAPAHAILPGLRVKQPLSFALRDPGVLAAIPLVAATGDAHTVEYGARVASERNYEVRLRQLARPDEVEVGDPAVALFFRDLSAERRTETMRVDFIANVSHELRTPLASLVGFIDTLQGPARDDPTARERFLSIMATQAGRMTRLIDDLLRLSSVELKEHLPPSTPVDLAITVAHMTEVMAPLAAERGVAIALDVPDEPVGVLGDRDELLRLVENLLENAIKYGGDGKRVEVSLVRVAQEGGLGRAELTVRDYGPGIAPEHLPRLTERFYRVDVADSRSRGGTGLGLAIVKHIVGRHRGRLLIDSEPGTGTTARVSLPEHAL